MKAVAVGRDGGGAPNENGPFHRGDGRGRSSRLRELLGRASHARKLPTDGKVESRAKEEEAGAVHEVDVMRRAPAVKGLRQPLHVQVLRCAQDDKTVRS